MPVGVLRFERHSGLGSNRIADRADLSTTALLTPKFAVPSWYGGKARSLRRAAAFREGWFLTGDFVKRDSDGCFHFVARKKDIIRRRGENIAGAELDRIMALHPAVSEAAAIAVDAELGEDEIMAVVVKKSDHPLTAKEIRDWCAARLAAHKVPRFVIFLDALPHTPTHKVAKYILKQDKSLRGNAVDFQKK